VKLGVLVSGTGTNLQALLDAEARGDLAPGEIALVLSNRPGVQALARAQHFGKPAIVIDHRQFTDRVAFEDQLLAALAAYGVHAVVLAGFMRVLTEHFINHYPLRIINTHPSLLPAFPGTHAPQQAIDYGVKVAGVTVHFVDTNLDGGPIIAQAAVPVRANDDAAALHARIQREEHTLLPRVVQRLAAGRLVCEGRRVIEVAARAE
jgi:phosphoribosylglycinamide formyltransferase-1